MLNQSSGGVGWPRRVEEMAEAQPPAPRPSAAQPAPAPLDRAPQPRDNGKLGERVGRGEGEGERRKVRSEGRETGVGEGLVRRWIGVPGRFPPRRMRCKGTGEGGGGSGARDEGEGWGGREGKGED